MTKKDNLYICFLGMVGSQNKNFNSFQKLKFIKNKIGIKNYVTHINIK